MLAIETTAHIIAPAVEFVTIGESAHQVCGLTVANRLASDRPDPRELVRLCTVAPDGNPAFNDDDLGGAPEDVVQTLDHCFGLRERAACRAESAGYDVTHGR
jgi:hypothetical protein